MTRLTESSFWDSEWRKLNFKNSVIKNTHFYFGTRGIFTKMTDRFLVRNEVKKILEVGGGGQNYRLLALTKWREMSATVVDYSPVALEMVKNVFDANHETIELVNADFESYDANSKYDMVVHWGVLEHFTNPATLINKCASYLRPGGHLLFTMPNMEAVGARAWKRWAPDNWSKHHFHTDKDVLAVMSDAGFTSTKSLHYGMPLVGSTWEASNIITATLTGLQRGISLATRIAPAIADSGNKYISSERVFHGIKT